ncbi:MAG: tetratricopeptide repeat-containing sensor histidine kinase [Bacteroidota bacterium]
MKLTGLWIDSGYYLRTRPYLDSFYAANKISTDNAIAAKYERLAELYFYNEKEFAISSLYLDSLQILLEKEKGSGIHKNIKLTYYFLRGNLAIGNKKYDDAFKYYYKGKKLIDSSPNTCGIQRYYNTLGYILFRQDKFLEAAEYMKKSYNEAPWCNLESRDKIATVQREALSNIGICYENANKLDSAIFYYHLALQYVEANKEKFEGKELAALKFKGVILGNLGGTLFKQKKFEEATGVLKQSIAINSRPEGERGDAILTKIKLADLYLETENDLLFKALIMELDTDVVKHPYIIADLRLALLKHKFYTRQKDYGKALQYLNLHNALKDSVKASSNYNIENHADHVKEFEKLEQEFELELMKHQSELKNKYIYLAAVIALMGVIITSLLLRRRSVNKKHIEELTELNRTVGETNARLTQSLELLQKSQDENTRIIKIVAHDLRSPIAGIMTLVRMIRQDANELTKEEFAEYIELVEKAGGNALNFIEDMLYFNRTNKELVKKEVNIEKLIESCVSILQPQANIKKQQIHFSVQPVFIKVNEEKIWRLINNIVSNAIKFSPPSTQVTISTRVENDALVIAIKDEGTGIPDSVKDKMFTMFSMSGFSGTNGEQSYGLGMAISKQIVDAHNGRIWFETAIGKGTTFYVELPMK